MKLKEIFSFVVNVINLYVIPVHQEHYGSVLAPYKSKTFIFAPDGTAGMYLNKTTTLLENVEVTLEGNTIRYKIPKALFALPETDEFALDFKWADGIDADNTVEDFYLHGDTALLDKPENRI